MKAIIIADTPTILTVRIDSDIDQIQCYELVGVEGTYHKRANGLWIIVKS